MRTQASTGRRPLESDSRARILVRVADIDQASGPLFWACREADRLHASLQVVSGPPAQVLDAIDENTVMVVVGRRLHAAVQHQVLGSTSQVVAGCASVPVVVVPARWAPMQPATSPPLVVGVSGRDRDEAVLRFAFERSVALGVSLVVVHAWEISPLLSWSPDDLDDRRTRVTDGIERWLGPWRARFPDLEVVIKTPAERSVDAVLDAGRGSQLVIIGRHGKRGSHLGSTARGVLHRAEVPVAVVPVEPLRANRRKSTRVGSGVWAPTY